MTEENFKKIGWIKKDGWNGGPFVETYFKGNHGAIVEHSYPFDNDKTVFLTFWIKDPVEHEDKTGKWESVAFKGVVRDMEHFDEIVKKYCHGLD